MIQVKNITEKLIGTVSIKNGNCREIIYLSKVTNWFSCMRKFIAFGDHWCECVCVIFDML